MAETSSPGNKMMTTQRFFSCAAALAVLGVAVGSFEKAPALHAGDTPQHSSSASPAGDTIEIEVPLSPETVPGATADPQQTAVVVACGNEARPPRLPPVADTHLWKESEKPAGNAATVVLRDNRWSQGLFRIDPGRRWATAVQRAVFRFKAGGSERPGNARIQFHRMLVDWSESATWSKPFPDRPETWNGLRPGRDYEAEPFAVLSLDEWKKGGHGRGARPGEGGRRPGARGTWPNYGFLVLFWGKALQVGIPSREAKPPAGPGGHHARRARKRRRPSCTSIWPLLRPVAAAWPTTFAGRPCGSRCNSRAGPSRRPARC